MTTQTKHSSYSRSFNRIGYILLTIAGITQWILHDHNSALPTFVLALVFDPFDQNIKWNDRPLYQRIIPIAQLTVAAAGLAFTLAN